MIFLLFPLTITIIEAEGYEKQTFNCLGHDKLIEVKGKMANNVLEQVYV